jgi:hypothetical protein
MTVARHKMGDYAPYVYKTTDWGDSWSAITDGLPDGEFCRVVREDPNRPDLLYVGTELGLHVSFDGGAGWQPLQANLPVTPVYDLLVKDTDLVVATHGRSFWILDDLTQLYQAAGGWDPSAATLLVPRDAVRTPPDLFAGFWGSPGGKNYHVTIGQNATFYLDEARTGHKTKRIIDAGTDLERGVRFTYWLPEEPHDGGDGAEVTLTIVDGDGNEIETFSSDIPEEKSDRKARLYLTAEPGMNVFQWDMRHRSGPKVEGSDFHGPSTGPLALPGRYSATLRVGDGEATAPVEFELLVDPRVTTSMADFEAQFELLWAIQAKQDEAVTAVNRIRALRRRLGDWKERIGDDDADLGPAIETLVERLDGIENELIQPEFTSPGDTLNYREKLIEKLSGLPAVVGSADTAPTKQSYQVFDKLGGQIDDQLGVLDEVIEGDLAALNGRLAESGLPIVGP